MATKEFQTYIHVHTGNEVQTIISHSGKQFILIIDFLLFRATLNVCLAYTSRQEISNAVKLMAEGVELGLLKPR